MRVNIKLPENSQMRKKLIRSLRNWSITINYPHNFILVHGVWDVNDLKLPLDTEIVDIQEEYPSLPFERLKSWMWNKILKIWG